ncbi:MAG: thiol-disulfide oxidoreductase DCC family protein [Terrimicrobiaceae bacterium]
MLSTENPILLIDGDCILCNRAAKWIIRHDREGRILFCTLGSPRALRILQERGLKKPPGGTSVLITGQNIHIRSEAILRVLAVLPFPWPVVSRIGLSIPRPLRDAAYSVVARLRIVLFGRTTSCQLLTASERTRVLD